MRYKKSMRGKRHNSGSRLVAWLGGSVGTHLVLAALATHHFLAPVPAPVAMNPMHAVEVEAFPAPPTASALAPLPDSPELAARLGDPTAPAAQRPADSLSLPSRDPGALAGQGSPAPHRRALTGEDLDELRFQPFSHRTRQSPSRIRTDREAVSPDNQRRTPNPRASPHLVSGTRGQPWRTRGKARQRRGRDRRTAATGARTGGDLDQTDRQEEALNDAPGAHRFLWPRRKTDQGAAAGFRRPDLERGAPTTLTRRLDLALADDRVRHQASRQLMPSLLDAARAAGAGEESGRGRGSRSGRRGDPEGEPDGPAIWLNNPDRRYLLYFRRVHRKIQPLWTFPRNLQVLMEQGDVLVRFNIQADGCVTDLRVTKPSGYPRFDRNVVAAIRQAAPFGPIPRGLGREVQVVAPFQFNNPMVR